MRITIAALVLAASIGRAALACEGDDSGCLYQVTADDFLAVKEKPTLKSRRVTTIPANVVFPIYGTMTPGEWAQFPGFWQPDRKTFTYTKAPKGWVNTKYLKKLDCFG